MNIKLKRITFLLLTLFFALNFSVVSNAEMYLPGSIPAAQPQGLMEGGFGLGMNQSRVIDLAKGSLQAAMAASQPSAIAENAVYHPGEILLIPVLQGSYDDRGRFLEADNVPQWKGVPSNWRISISNQNPGAIDDIRWHISTEPGGENYLYVMVIFSKVLEGTQQYALDCNVCIEDTQTALASNSIYLKGSFENRSVQAMQGSLTIISTPTTISTTSDYTGGSLNFQIDKDINFQGAALSNYQTVYINLNRNYDSHFANKVKQFDLQFYNFLGDQDHFASPGNLSLPASGQEAYVYEIVDGRPNRLVSTYDDEMGIVSITTGNLGYYVVSNSEILISTGT